MRISALYASHIRAKYNQIEKEDLRKFLFTYLAFKLSGDNLNQNDSISLRIMYFVYNL